MAYPAEALFSKTAQTRPEAIESQSRVPELDSLRALAILMVMVGHIFYAFPVSDNVMSSVPGMVRLVLSHGWVGVDLFFILSGFLITGILLKAKNKPRYFANFYRRRALRILPLYLLTIAIMWSLTPHTSAFFISSLGFMSNFADYLGLHRPHAASVLWSLAVEEHFYLIWPWLVLYLNKRALTAVSIGILVFSPLLRGIAAAHGTIPELIYNFSWFRFDGLALGSLVAIWMQSRYKATRPSLILAAGLIGAALALTLIGLPFGIMQEKNAVSLAFRFTQVQLPFAALLLFAFCLRGRPVTSFMRLGWVCMIGQFSYCLYLVHLGVGDIFQWFIKSYGLYPTGEMNSLAGVLLRGAVTIAVSLLLAAISFKYFETPFLRLKEKPRLMTTEPALSA